MTSPRHLGIYVFCLLVFTSFAGLARAAQNETEIQRLFKEHHFKQTIVKPPKGILKYPYLVPSGPYFQLFDWDMYFMGVALSHDGVGQPLATSVENFLYFVNRNANDRGYVPREIAPEGFWALPEMCKPFLAQAAVRASLTMHNFQWLTPYYGKLADTLHFWEDARQSPDGLFRWYNGVESGVDNNPAVSDRPAATTEGVDLACYIDREYQAMALIAARLGKTQDEAHYNHKADALRQLIQKRMWSEADGMFWDIDSRTGKFIRVKTWTNFVPLWAGIATPEQAHATIERHLLNPREFWSAHGIRTLAPDEPLYNPVSGYWRGPVWVISNYLLMHGLMNYGYHQQAVDLAHKTVRLLVDDLRRTGGMNECYNPETGAPAAGGHFLSWDLLGEHMVQEATRGADPTALK
ncbi:MAG TPA: trehalase family glycosidase [Terriglobia bacterium]|nr:trehalase family glycosidase [Terriglobia bacterium]